MIVKIKTWAMMEKEYGLNSLGSIDTYPNFTTLMEKQMTRSRMIEIKHPKYNDSQWRWKKINSLSIPWNMKDWMFEKIIQQ